MKTQARRVYIHHARPSFLEGMARVLDIGGTLSYYIVDDHENLAKKLTRCRLTAPTGFQADGIALKNVWANVGHCLQLGIGSLETSGLEEERQLQHLET